VKRFTFVYYIMAPTKILVKISSHIIGVGLIHRTCYTILIIIGSTCQFSSSILHNMVMENLYLGMSFWRAVLPSSSTEFVKLLKASLWKSHQT